MSVRSLNGLSGSNNIYINTLSATSPLEIPSSTDTSSTISIKGLSGFGSAGQVVKVNSGANGLEYGTESTSSNWVADGTDLRVLNQTAYNYVELKRTDDNDVGFKLNNSNYESKFYIDNDNSDTIIETANSKLKLADTSISVNNANNRLIIGSSSTAITIGNSTDFTNINGIKEIKNQNERVIFSYDSSSSVLGLNNTTDTLIIYKSILDLPKIKSSSDFTYNFAVNSLSADRTITLPLLTGNDEFVFKDFIQILSNKTLTLPKINDTSSNHTYNILVSELVADRNITLPLLTGNDEFVFKDFTQILSNKQLLDTAGGNMIGETIFGNSLGNTSKNTSIFNLFSCLNSNNRNLFSYNASTNDLTFGNATDTITTLNSILTLPKINDTSSNHTYNILVSELSANRNITLPLLTGNDEFVFKDFIQILSNKTLTLPKINDTSSNHTYNILVSELVANRNITLPLLAGNDTFCFEAHTQTLTNKTLTLPKINDTSSNHTYNILVSELSANRNITLPLLTGNDEFVFKDFTQILSNKQLLDSAGGNMIGDTIFGNTLGNTSKNTSIFNLFSILNSNNRNLFSYNASTNDLTFGNATDTITTLNSILTLPKINDTSSNHTYNILVSELVANRNITLPLLAGNDTFCFEAHIQTLTNKTLTSPVINTSISGTAILDEDNMGSNSNTKLATQQSIKAYVDNHTGLWELNTTSYNNIRPKSLTAYSFINMERSDTADTGFMMRNSASTGFVYVGGNKLILEAPAGEIRLNGTDEAITNENDKNMIHYISNTNEFGNLTENCKYFGLITTIQSAGTIQFNPNSTQMVEFRSDFDVKMEQDVDIYGVNTNTNADASKLPIGDLYAQDIYVEDVYLQSLKYSDTIYVEGAPATGSSSGGFTKRFEIEDRGLYLYQSPWGGTGNATVGRASWLITCGFQQFRLEFHLTSTDGSLVFMSSISGVGVYTIEYSFTGQHKSKSINDTIYNNIDDYIGLICYSTGEYATYDFDTETCNSDKEGITINDAMPIIDLTTTKKDKRVYGVISNKENTDRTMSYGRFVSNLPSANDANRVIINSIGEGGIWIVNTNGNLENGDYIQSSNVSGYGEKQDDDLLHNYSVAKITCDCDFDINSIKYKSKMVGDNIACFVGCIYFCG